MNKTTVKHDTGNNTAATITQTAGDSEAIYITSISCSFSAAPAASTTLKVEEGNTTKMEIDIHDENIKQFEFTIPVKLTAGEDLTVTLGASGTADVIGKLNVAYFIGE